MQDQPSKRLMRFWRDGAGVLSLLVAVMCIAACGGSSATYTTYPIQRPTADAGVTSLDASTPTDASSDVVAHARLEYASRIDDDDTFLSLAARPQTSPIPHTEVVKFALDVQTNEMHYFNTDRWVIHYYFCRDRLNFTQDHAAFNVEQYRRPTRRFILGSVIRYADQNLVTFELVAGDNLDAERVVQTYNRIIETTHFGNTIKFRPISPLHETTIRGLGSRLPTIEMDSVFRAIRYQMLTPGVAYGTLRIIRGPLDINTLAPTDIVVTRDVPEELPTVSALITSVPQAPLAHVPLLLQNRNTPNMALRGAVDEATVTSLDGILVRLQITPQEFTLTRTNDAEARAAWAQRRPPAPSLPAPDLRATRIADLCDLRMSSTGAYGAKASQLGEICAAGFRTPGGFTIPLSHYFAHLDRLGVRAGIPAMARDQGVLSNRATRASRLGQLSQIINQGGIDPALLREVQRRVASMRGRIILRSSTNAEDLPGFNGAGLYRSVVVGPNPSAADLERAIKDVWSSVWTLRGFDEREWFSIPHDMVGMAILVQPFVPDGRAMGVALTRNPFHDQRPAIFLNVQSRGGSVTDARDVVPEQHLVYTYSEVLEDEILSRSSLNNGAVIMDEATIESTVRAMMRLHERLTPLIAPQAGALDVEFILSDTQGLVFVQARSAPTYSSRSIDLE